MSLTNTQYDTIMRVYQSRQTDRQHEIAARKAALARRSPELVDLDKQMAHLSVQKAKMLLAGRNSALTELKAQLHTLQTRKETILSDLGLPADYLEPPYVCEKCKDTGYVGMERCSCFKQSAIDLVYSQSNLADILERENFEHFSLDYYAKDLMDSGNQITSYQAAYHAYQKCRQFTDHFREGGDNILLYGETGVGKTFLSHCVAKELLDQGYSVIYFSAQNFFDALAQKTFGRDPQAEADYENMMSCDLLIIDDLGTEMSNSFTTSQFFVVLNERLRNNKAVLISSNLELYDIANIYSERVSSRISDSFTMLHLFGRDIRIQKKLAIR